MADQLSRKRRLLGSPDMKNSTFWHVTTRVRYVGYIGVVTKSGFFISAQVHTLWRPTRKWAHHAAVRWAEKDRSNCALG